MEMGLDIDDLSTKTSKEIHAEWCARDSACRGCRDYDMRLNARTFVSDSTLQQHWALMHESPCNTPARALKQAVIIH